jgi:hypothetical protein
MSVTDPDWSGLWPLKALIPPLVVWVYAQWATLGPLEAGVFLAVFETMLLLTYLEDTAHVSQRTKRVGIGVVGLAAGGSLFAVDGELWLTFLLLGLFSVARATLGDVGGDLLEPSSHAFTAGAAVSPTDDPVAGEVLAALSDRPHTRRELWEAVDSDADTIDDALATLQECGTVTRAGSEFSVDRST